LRADDKALDVDEFLGKLSRPRLPSEHGVGSSSHGAPGASRPAEANEEDESEDTRRRFTAAEKGKQREGEPVPSIARGPTALKPAVPDNLQSLAPKMPTQGLRLLPRRLSSDDEIDEEDEDEDEDEDTASVQQVEYAGVKSTASARVWSAGNSPAEFLKEARRKLKFAAELPLDGLGVVRDRSSVQRQPWEGSTGYPSSVAMERTQSQMGVPDPTSRLESAIMERTPSRAGTPASSSQEYIDLVAESNRRLEELSPYFPQGRVPDTPMPYLKIGTVDVEPPPSPLSPASEADDPSDGDGPRLGTPEPGHPPISPKKRDSSEISGGCLPGPSKRRRPWRPAGPSAKVGTVFVNGQERPISKGQLRAIDLLPPPSVQKELCKLYSVLVQVVQAASEEFIVVQPHDFIEVLSWSESDEAGGAEVTQRVREQATRPDRLHRKLLVPFSFTADMFLAVIDLGTTAFQIFDQRTEQDPESGEIDDGFETEISQAVFDFIRTVCPDQCPSYRGWTKSIERTVQGPVAINTPGIVSGRFVNELGGRIQLRSILPFFFEVLRIVCHVETRITVNDNALLTRLFAIFEGSLHPDMSTATSIEHLRRLSQAELTSSLEGRVKQVLKHHDRKFRIMVKATEPRLSGRYTPRDLIYLRPTPKTDVLNAVRQSQDATISLMIQYAQTRLLLEGMVNNCIDARSSLHHQIVRHMTERWFYSVDATKEFLEPEAAKNQFKSQGLNELTQKFQKIKAELDHWLGMFNDHLDSVVMK
jgi:hypothetical protein